MKTILIFILFIVASLSFQFFGLGELKFSFKLTPSLGCSDTRVKAVNDSISQCEFFGHTLATECMKNYLFTSTNGQKWDVMAEIPLKSDAKSSFWAYDDCSIRYENWGRVNLTYTVWKAAASSQSSSDNEKEAGSIKYIVQALDPNDACTQARVKAAKDAINFCQNNDMTMEASCIRNNIKARTGQKWNAVIATDGKSLYSIRYSYFDNCIVEMNSFGTRKRNYLIWKAE